MKIKLTFRFTTPREFDERVQYIQLLVIRDTFQAILLMAALFIAGLAFFPVFVKEHLGEIGGAAVLCVGLVGWISNRLHGGGQDLEQKVPFAKGDLLIAPITAAIMVFLFVKLIGMQASLPEWFILYGATLPGSLVYPLFILLRIRKRAHTRVQPLAHHDDKATFGEKNGY